MKRSLYTCLLLFLLLPGYLTLKGQSIPDTIHNDSIQQGINKNRLTSVSVIAGSLYVTSMVGLYQLWYADYPKSTFHWINDNGEWEYMDKVGHMTSSYWIGRIGYESLRWSGLEKKKAIWYGGTWGLIYLTSVEVFDGFSAEWGASGGDLAANTLGAVVFIGQQLIFDDQIFTLKFSYSPTDYPDYRPDLLGESGIQSIVKDYNGQTYWLSANIASFLPTHSKFPKWLDVSLGYGAEGMLGAASNPPYYNGKPLPEVERYSQYYLSFDVDLTKIKTKNETVRLLLNMIGWIKIPAPAVEFNRVDKVKFYWFYF